jgi:hypothetical protein
MLRSDRKEKERMLIQAIPRYKNHNPNGYWSLKTSLLPEQIDSRTTEECVSEHFPHIGLLLMER